MDGLEGIAVYENLIKDGEQAQLKCTFMDYHMPKCSGIDAMKMIRAIEKRRPELLPCYLVAFTVGLSETSTRDLIRGANQVLVKTTPTGQLEDICSRLTFERGTKT